RWLKEALTSAPIRPGLRARSQAHPLRLVVLAAPPTALQHAKASSIHLDEAPAWRRQGRRGAAVALWAGVGAPVGPHEPMLLEPAIAQGLRAEPMGSRGHAHGADDAGDLAGMQQR